MKLNDFEKLEFNSSISIVTACFEFMWLFFSVLWAAWLSHSGHSRLPSGPKAQKSIPDSTRGKFFLFCFLNPSILSLSLNWHKSEKSLKRLFESLKKIESNVPFDGIILFRGPWIVCDKFSPMDHMSYPEIRKCISSLNLRSTTVVMAKAIASCLNPQM